MYTMDPWTHYDPEGYIHACRKSQKLGDYDHYNIEDEEKFKNMEWLEIQQMLQEHKKELEEKRKQELEQFRNDIGNLLDSLVLITRTLDRLEIQALEYDI